MKKIISAGIAVLLLLSVSIPVAAADSFLHLAQQFDEMRPALVALFAIVCILTLICIILTLVAMNRRSKKKGSLVPVLVCTYLATVLTIVLAVFCFLKYQEVEKFLQQNPPESIVETQPSTQAPVDPTTEPTTEPEETTEEPTTEPPTEPDPTFTPEFCEVSDPANFGVKWEIITDGSVVSEFQREDYITFGDPSEFFALEGISTFRGNNYRNDASFGTAEISQETVTKIWGKGIGSLNGWPGSGWTGQPLVVRWDEDTRKIMNLYESKKEKDGLVEVILATLDGYVYFYDLEDGSYTRDPIYLGMNFKGSGSIDPRGYPVMYVGSGVSLNGVSPKIYIVNLITGKIMYEKSGYDSQALRGWTAFDSSPLISGETDTLIWPGENGMLYTIKLNTQYDKEAGTLTMEPEQVVKTRYSTKGSNSGRYLGYECSAAAVGEYLYLSENGGMFFCIDLNTMELVWAQDTKDDSNSSPVFAWEEDGNGYLYTAPSLHWTQSNSRGYVSVYKINAATGEIVWEVPFHCHTIPDLSGGVQGSPLMGRKGTDLEGIIIYPLARTDGFYDGALVALDTATGSIVWQYEMDNYTWSSPVGVYTEEGKGYVVVCDSYGNVLLLDGATGKQLDYVNLGSNIEASPVVFENTLVVGTRGGLVCGIRLN